MLHLPPAAPAIDAMRSDRAGSLGVVLLLGAPPGSPGTISSELEHAGFEVRQEPSLVCVHGEDAGADALVIYLDGAPCDGLASCTAWRSTKRPAIALTGDMSDEVVLDAYGAGADYVAAADTAPSIVTAHLRALLRRVPGAHASIRSQELPVVDETAQCAIVAGAKIALAGDELSVLKLLLAAPGKVVRRQQIRDVLASDAPRRRQERLVDSCIRRLRDKLEEQDGARQIVAVRGVGFRFDVARLEEAEG